MSARFICPDAPAQVTVSWDDMRRDECPWCHRPLISHDHTLWSILQAAADRSSEDLSPSRETVA